MDVRGEGAMAGGGSPGTIPSAGEALPPPRRLNVAGDIDDLLDRRPFFRTRWRGYDRLEVDNYATWAEAELATARRYSTHLLARYGQCAADLERLRCTPSRPPRTPEPTPVTERLGEMLRLAAEEAAGITAAGIDEAERIVAEACAEAEERLRKVENMREAVEAAGEELRRERSAASDVLARARAEAAELLSAAEAERERLAAEAAARLEQVQAEVDDLRQQRDEARESLHRLTARIEDALRAAASVAAGPSGPPVEVAVPADRRESLATSAP